MRIVMDGTPLSVSSGGIARYTAELSRALAERYPGDWYWLAADQPFALPASEGGNLCTGRRPRSFLGRRWWSLGLPGELLRLRADVFHGTDFAVPYLPLRPSVMTVHDLSPWLSPEWHHAAERVRQRTPVLLKLGLATMVITPSETIRRAVIDRFQLPASRVAAAPLAASACFRPSAPAAPAKPYFLYVGVLEPRKNIPLILEAWRQVRRRHPVDLILAGRRREDFDAPVAEEGLRLAGEVAEAELPALYSGAVAVLYPSRYEGFGLPVVEAMRCGAAVFASLDPAVAEVAGDAALRLDARRPDPWIQAMEAALTQPDWLGELREGSLRRGREFSWKRTAERTREVYAEAIARFGA